MHYGWRIFWEPAPHEPFAHGFYKLKTNLNTNYVYLDFRDCQFANQSYTPWYSTTDFSIKYNGLTDEFSYKNSLDSTFTSILPKACVRIGDIKNGIAVTTCFDSYWSNCLIVIQSQIGNHPRLVWGPYPEEVDVVEYKIYRKIGNGYFHNIHTISNANTFDWVDVSINIWSGQNGNEVEYYITCLYDIETESDTTNHVNTRVNSQAIEKRISEREPVNYSLDQNHPNPFNSTTKIKFTIPTPSLSSPLSNGGNEAGFVTLKVYDILGREITTLVDEYKSAGSYEVEFSGHSDEGQNLSSGVYFYQLRIRSPEINSGQGIIQTKKMILLK